MRGGVPIVPIAVVGAEESMPFLWTSSTLARAVGLPYAGITANMALLGPVGAVTWLPAKFKLRFREPIHFEEEGMHEDKALVQTVAHEVRARIQENLWDMLAKRKSVWFG